MIRLDFINAIFNIFNIENFLDWSISTLSAEIRIRGGFIIITSSAYRQHSTQIIKVMWKIYKWQDPFFRRHQGVHVILVYIRDIYDTMYIYVYLLILNSLSGHYTHFIHISQWSIDIQERCKQSWEQISHSSEFVERKQLRNAADSKTYCWQHDIA